MKMFRSMGGKTTNDQRSPTISWNQHIKELETYNPEGNTMSWWPGDINIQKETNSSDKRGQQWVRESQQTGTRKVEHKWSQSQEITQYGKWWRYEGGKIFQFNNYRTTGTSHKGNQIESHAIINTTPVRHSTTLMDLLKEKRSEQTTRESITKRESDKRTLDQTVLDKFPTNILRGSPYVESELNSKYQRRICLSNMSYPKVIFRGDSYDKTKLYVTQSVIKKLQDSPNNMCTQHVRNKGQGG